MPKLPPTSPDTTRTAVSGTPSTPASSRFCRTTPLVLYTERDPLLALRFDNSRQALEDLNASALDLRPRRHKREAGPGTRRYFVDACHPVWGVDLLYSCWLLTGQRFYVGVGNGRKRLNILGAYCPDDHDYVDLRLTKENITGEQFVKLLEKMLAKHPDTEKFILYLDNARYYSKPVVKEWLAQHRQFRDAAPGS